MMGKLVHAELVKVGRSLLPWVLGSFLVLVDAFLFVDFTSRDSSVFEPSLLPLGQVASLFLGVMLATVNVIPAVLIGCSIGGRDYGSRTAGSVAHWGGRYRPLVAKVVVTVFVLGIVVMATALLGFVLGLVYDTSVARVDFTRLMAQTGIVFLATAMLGVLALTVAMLVRSVALGNVICLVVLLGQMFVPGAAGRALGFVNPLTLLGVFAGPAFSNMNTLVNVVLAFDSDITAGRSVIGLGVYLTCCLVVLGVVARFREYR